jgi:hypothetical protein
VQADYTHSGSLTTETVIPDEPQRKAVRRSQAKRKVWVWCVSRALLTLLFENGS